MLERRENVGIFGTQRLEGKTKGERKFSPNLFKDGNMSIKQFKMNVHPQCETTVRSGENEVLAEMMHRHRKMLFLLAKPESGAGRPHCLARRFFLRSQRAEGWCRAARWAPGGWAADGLPSAAKQKGKRGECQHKKKTQSREEWGHSELFHFNDCGFNASALDFDSCYDCSTQIAPWGVRLTLPSSFKIKKMNRRRMFTCKKQQVNTVLCILCAPAISTCFSVDVYTWHVFTGFNMKGVCVCDLG